MYISKGKSIKSFDKYTKAAFIDASGSTGTNYNGKSILQVEKKLVNQILNTDEPRIYWSDFIVNGSQPMNGTQPSCIFENTTSQNIFSNSEIVIFCTDGEIQQHEVTKFANKLKQHLNKVLYVCIIVHYKKNDLSNLNISVIAPLMVAPNVLCVYHDFSYNNTKIIASKGPISNIYPNPESKIYSQLPNINIADLMKIRITDQVIPNNLIVLSEDEERIRVADVGELFNRPLLDCSFDEWLSVVKYCTVNGLNNKLRDLITKTRNIEINSIRTKDFPLIKERDRILNRMSAAYVNGNREEHLELKAQLDRIMDDARREELEYINVMRERLSPIKKKWDMLRDELFRLESGTGVYSLANFSFASNRAKRAECIEDDNDDDERVIFDGCREIECIVHLDNGPDVLWLKSFDDIGITTSDFCINFPLAKFDGLDRIFVSNPVCGYCASSYLKHRKESVYRERIDGFIPMNWEYKQNRQFAMKTLYKIFCDGKVLNHVGMLLLSAIDECELEWMKFKDEYIGKLIDDIVTNDSFSEEGNKMLMMDALAHIVKNEANMLRQPFDAQIRILKFSFVFGKASTEVLIDMLRKCFAYLLVVRYCNLAKNTRNVEVNDMIDTMLFETVCGIVQEGKNKIITLDDIERFIGFELSGFRKLCDILRIDLETVVPNTMLYNVLWHLSLQTAHDRPMTLYLNLSSKNILFRKLIVDNIYDHVNKQKFNHHKGYSVIPPFAFNNGRYSCPSKLWFYDEGLWSKKIEGTKISISDLACLLSCNLDRKLVDKYGSVYPSENSGHVMLHRTVADVCCDIPDAGTDDIVIEVMKRFMETRGHYGNIYREGILNGVILVVHDFCRIRKMPNYETGKICIDKTFVHKLESELRLYGMEIDNGMVYFDPTKITKPIMLNDLYKDLDLVGIENRIQEKFTGTNTISDNTVDKFYSFEIDDGFVVGSEKMKIEECFDSWECEQKDMVSKLVLEDTVDINKIRYIGGMDISFADDGINAVACLIVHDFMNLRIVGKFIVRGKVYVPYKAGFLAFREAPLLLKLLHEVKGAYAEIMPDVLLIDGNGIWHKRGCGLASHLSMLSGIPTIGVTKKVLDINGVTRNSVMEEMEKNAPNKGDYIEIRDSDAKSLGYACNVTGSIKKATFISPGNSVSLGTSLKIVQHMTKYRINESIRQADLISRMLLD